MKFLKYYLFISFFLCGCTDAATNEKAFELSCPYVLPAAKDIPASWVILGKINGDKFQLRSIGIVDGNASEEKKRVLEAHERMFTDEIFDEWTSFKDRSEAVAEYDESHDENSMKCTYGRTQEESFDVNKNIVLLIPLPIKKPVTCLLVRRNIDPTHEISCKVK